MASTIVARRAIASTSRCHLSQPSSSRVSGAVATRYFSSSVSRRADSDDGSKKQGFFSWLRSDLTEKVIKDQPSASEVEAAKQAQEAQGEANLFDSVSRKIESREQEELRKAVGGDVPEGMTAAEARRMMKRKAGKPAHTEHRYSTASFKISHRKLNALGRQISGKPIDQAVLQMMFSEKKASTRIKSMLCIARDHAVDYKGLDRSRLVVSQAWVEKGSKQKRVDIKGRGRTGIKEHVNARLRVILSHGLTYEERIAKEHAYKLGKIRSPGLMREDTPVRNYGPAWAW
ncbi:ribosomal protein L22 [Clavulina sp. PMI_390]|nr:ribosomal protein L22 [Clavulina sp. PMI_390]